MQNKINWLAIAACIVAGMFIGFLWYGVFFNTQWSEAVGLTGPGLISEGGEVFKHGKSVVIDPATPMIVNILLMFTYGMFMHWLANMTNHKTLAKGAMLGAIIGLIIAASHAVGNLFAMDSSMLTIVDGSYHLVLFAVIGGIIGGWRKK